MTAVDKSKRTAEALQSMEQCCLAVWEPLYRFIYLKVQNREEAEDITQETYVKTLTYLQTHELPQDNFLGFMKTTALNILRDRWRQNKRRGIIIHFTELHAEITAGLDQQKSIHQQLQIESALARLSEGQRTILDLRIIKGYSVAETARLVGKTEAAVRTAQYRALQALAQTLEADH